MRLNKEILNLIKKSSTDPCVYYKGEGENLLLAAIYVDDILMAARNIKTKERFKKHLMKKFKVKDLGIAKYCLSIEIPQDRSRISLSQPGYIKDILARFGISDLNAVSTPIDPGANLR